MKLFGSTVVTVAAFALTGTAQAQTATFTCPPPGTTFTFKGDGHASIVLATGRDGDVCLAKRTSAGQSETLRVHCGLIGSVDAAGEAYIQGIDLQSLWPLKVGNKTTQAVSSTGRDGKSYTSDVTMTVAAYEKIIVPAGTFDIFRVEETKVGDAAPRIHW